MDIEYKRRKSDSQRRRLSDGCVCFKKKKFVYDISEISIELQDLPLPNKPLGPKLMEHQNQVCGIH